MSHRFICGERKISWNIKKSQNIMKVVVAIRFLHKINQYVAIEYENWNQKDNLNNNTQDKDRKNKKFVEEK